ncbi:MAG: hypothetical protein HY393_03890 [Candidatus Diapherotrites archaeon]|nr:hypothetical protein [Candidatus Diapherotrites archaeon]
MEPLELTISELERLHAKQDSMRARIHLETAIENLRKFLSLQGEGAVDLTKKR